MTLSDSPRRCVRLLTWGVFLWGAAAAHATEAAHVHGLMRLDIAVEQSTLTVQLEAPLDSLLGFERAPRTAAERQAADALLQRMGDGASLFKPSAAAQCRPTEARVDSPVLQTAGSAAHGAGHEHADLDASYAYRCTHPEQLAHIEVGLFEAFRRLQRIEVQVAGPQQQLKQTLQRPDKRVPLRR